MRTLERAMGVTLLARSLSGSHLTEPVPGTRADHDPLPPEGQRLLAAATAGR
jgi:hypothetical protein